jgi:hypothetical protein
VWAKVDMIDLLPVERALYLDSDVLVRADLKQLWDIDLQGKKIGAVTDIGFPQGHEEIVRQPYFNAGVLLMDLAKMRGRIDDVKKLAREMGDAKFRDQDCLNIHFSKEWMPLHLQWNAQGLGTYATMSSEDRDLLCLEEMSDPRIVHFTGPVNPGLADVLDPSPRPSKPWGFYGAPTHPYAEEWWAVQDRTAWCGMRMSDEYWRMCEERKGWVSVYIASKVRLFQNCMLTGKYHQPINKLSLTDFRIELTVVLRETIMIRKHYTKARRCVRENCKVKYSYDK